MESKGETAMPINEIMKNLRRVQEEIANHKREWSGAMGTCWEREDYQRKRKELQYYSGMALIQGLGA